MRFPEGCAFGMDVTVYASLARLVADGTGYRELLRSRGYAAEKNGATFAPGAWPGAPVPLDWDAGPRDYPLEPDPARVTAVRVRRMLNEKPPRAVIVGCTYRQEGFIIDGTLLPPGRVITVLEVALNVRSGRARIVLAHPHDVQPVPRPRSRS